MTDSVVRHRRFSLVHQASMEKQLNEGVKRKNTLRQRDQLGAGILRGQKILQQLNDEGVELIWGAADKKYLTFSVVLSSDCSLAPFLTDLVESFSQAGVHILHLETRERRLRRGEQVSEGNTPGWDILAECGGTKEQMVSAAAALTASNESLRAIRLYRDARPETPWFPRHVSDLDKCSNCLTKYEPTVDERHPGFGDEAYIARRAELNNMSSSYRHGDPIPVVEYTPEEHATWKAVYEKLRTLHLTHTCDTYRKNLHQLEEEGVLSPERIPQLKDVNKFLMKKTGFMLRPCAGLLSARDFLASLAFRVFQTTQYLRHHAHPHHCPEPDLIHELLGHVPMFADEGIAQMSQDIGLMSLGASDEQIERLSTVYWFIVEFGLCREEGRLKAIGAGLLSAYGELEHACSDVPAHQDFDPSVTALQTYEDVDYQPLYFVADSIQDALGKLRAYALTMDRGFNVQYDPYTQSVAVIHSVSDLTSMLDRFRLDFAAVAQSIDYIRKHKKM